MRECIAAQGKFLWQQKSSHSFTRSLSLAPLGQFMSFVNWEMRLGHSTPWQFMAAVGQAYSAEREKGVCCASFAAIKFNLTQMPILKV